MTLEAVIQWLGGLFAYSTLVVVLYGLWRGTQHQPGRVTGLTGSWLRSPWFYPVTSALFFGISYLGWILLPWTISPSTRVWMLALGSLLYFPGMLFALWGRLALGKNYFASTGLGTQLFADHQLITTGPFALMRHPMYFGLILAAFGSLLIYVTWTTLFFAVFAPFIVVRARNEEQALAEEFGERWREYSKRVPAFLPRLKR
ncbi:MAG: isoprenylcysteine carboxylmethyltransferase family protein [Chloroflexi bacterium]|nr:isoprenylcysteine carboxylmethyltransferase family protein [Chloroflexota bacterium]